MLKEFSLANLSKKVPRHCFAYCKRQVVVSMFLADQQTARTLPGCTLKTKNYNEIIKHKEMFDEPFIYECRGPDRGIKI
ncbi:hypothetical protein QQG55_3290 [Brugia pahangi]